MLVYRFIYYLHYLLSGLDEFVNFFEHVRIIYFNNFEIFFRSDKQLRKFLCILKNQRIRLKRKKGYLIIY